MYRTRGFTLIELLVVIAIIGVLASVALSSLNDLREGATKARAQQELNGVMLGVQRLIFDTGKAPNGCPPNANSNPEVRLNTNSGGLLLEPPEQDNGWGCEWTAKDIENWNGPYIVSGIDMWGRPYWYDPDYIQHQYCPTIAQGPVIRAILTRGSDDAWYTCDDIYLELR